MAERQDSEPRQREALRAQLTGEFGDVPADELNRVIDAAWERYTLGRVKEFVTLLVERDVRRHMSSRPREETAG